MDALEEVAAEVLPQGMGYAWNAMSFQEKKASGSLWTILTFSLLFVFLILAAQYESWSLPFSILLGTPFAVFGAMLFLLVAAGFITTGLALKAAVFPLHAWLPNAYTYAPHAVTVFLAACATKVSLYVLLRFDFVVFQPNLAGHDIQFAFFLLPLAVLAIIVASAVAVFEKNLKRLLAYSSVAQIGYIMLGASLVSQAGLTASILHIFNHSLAKGTLFLAVAGLALRSQSLRLDGIAGAAKTMPWTMAAFVIGAFSLIGIPGTAGFISKWYLILAVLDQGLLGVALVFAIVVGSLLAVVYVWRVVEAAWFRAPPAEGAATREAPFELLAVTWVAALANLYFGIFTEVPVSLASMAAEGLRELMP